ncbi:glycosyl hydrolase 115 family protein [Mucilaginibacter lacusdianchii]|uniref:glycosyl hydrolase 115 family protein n=1 Tax=Mucilaginibacter lacusdianchii TaxID=2684211 RepID=UPI00131C9CB4|nr:glycosyl hydrolase 115 family protein [Mucilaginibacter sp. JXJ CY 39]
MQILLKFLSANLKQARRLASASCLVFICCGKQQAYATGEPNYVSAQVSAGSFALSVSGKSAPIYVSSADYAGVMRAAKDLQTDIISVTRAQPTLSTGAVSGKQVVLIGTIGKSPLIDKLIQQKKLNVAGIKGKWETFLLQNIEKPMPGVDRALVIAGSDKRGTIYGIYDLSSQIGVSPWYWWADVPTKTQKNLYVTAGRHSQGEPAVKYRGIFINDEAPAFSGWTKEKFGGFNHQMYAKMFELILRLKGNYLWPAMWGNAFNDDDPLNRATADEYGIVMGTSHHEPMDRAQTEWKRYGKGEWDYNKNGEELRNFWRKGIQNMGTAETIVTVGMRGDGDMAMEAGTNIALLEKIVGDQRKIITEVTGKPAEQTPQMWALYKEVQDYYDKGMRVPDDVTLLLCDDNWGNIRKLPKLGEKPRKGGYGIYYHFDYVGGPRNYKWLNTNPISKVWEQMHLAYDYNARQVWIVNVGDLKPMEYPISFFLDYAWNPARWPAGRVEEYTRLWAKEQFGAQYASQIADILSKYTKYNGRRKPELLDQNTYSLVNYQEFETVVNDYNKLKDEAEMLYKDISAPYKDAYYELVLHPVLACANLNELYYSTALNRWYAEQGRAATNDMADKVKDLYARDAEISKYYNTQLAGGKWNHMMDQTHIGYTYWQQPEANKMPEVKTIDIPKQAAMGVAVEGSTDWWPNATDQASLPQFSPHYKAPHYIEVFNRGKEAVRYTITCPSWITVSSTNGSVEKQTRLWVNVNWDKVPAGATSAPVTITGSDGVKVTVHVNLNNTMKAVPVNGFVQNNGYVSIEAEHYTKAVNSTTAHWLTIPDYGRTLSGVTPYPATAPIQKLGGNSPHLEYTVILTDTGTVAINAYISPTIDFTHDKSLKYAISFDEEQPQIFSVNAEANQRLWNKAVAENINILVSKHHISKPGAHTVKFWMVSPGVVLQKLVLDVNSGLKPSYLGPPESFNTATGIKIIN